MRRQAEPRRGRAAGQVPQTANLARDALHDVVDLRLRGKPADAETQRGSRQGVAEPHGPQHVRGLRNVGVAGRTGGNRHFRNRQLQALCLHAGKGHVEHVGRTLRGVSVQPHLINGLQTAPEAVPALGEQWPVEFRVRDFKRSAEADDLVRGKGARAQSTLLLSTVDHRSHVDAPSKIDRADSHGPVGLVSRE